MTTTEILRNATQDLHTAVESELAIVAPGASLETYRDFLSRNYGFYRALEPLIWNAPSIKDHLPDWHERLKLNLIADDLRALGENLPTISPQLSPLPSAAHALGALYVLEGSTLGAQVVSRILSKQIGPEFHAANRFLNAYGDARQSKWTCFKTVVNQTITAAESQAHAIESARETFAAYRQWFAPHSTPHAPAAKLAYAH